MKLLLVTLASLFVAISHAAVTVTAESVVLLDSTPTDPASTDFLSPLQQRQSSVFQSYQGKDGKAVQVWTGTTNYKILLKWTRTSTNDPSPAASGTDLFMTTWKKWNFLSVSDFSYPQTSAAHYLFATWENSTVRQWNKGYYAQGNSGGGQWREPSQATYERMSDQIVLTTWTAEPGGMVWRGEAFKASGYLHKFVSSFTNSPVLEGWNRIDYGQKIVTLPDNVAGYPIQGRLLIPTVD